MRFDPLGILKSLVEHQVDFIVIGGIAAAARGSPSTTVDLDICYRRDTTNLASLSTALRSMGARLRGLEEDIPFLLDEKTLAAGDHFTLTTDLGDLDLIGTPAGMSGYADLIKGATKMDLDGLTVMMAGVEDLIRMKRAAGRPKDLIELEVLGALRDELDDS